MPSLPGAGCVFGVPHDTPAYAGHRPGQARLCAFRQSSRWRRTGGKLPARAELGHTTSVGLRGHAALPAGGWRRARDYRHLGWGKPAELAWKMGIDLWAVWNALA